MTISNHHYPSQKSEIKRLNQKYDMLICMLNIDIGLSTSIPGENTSI